MVGPLSENAYFRVAAFFIVHKGCGGPEKRAIDNFRMDFLRTRTLGGNLYKERRKG